MTPKHAAEKEEKNQMLMVVDYSYSLSTRSLSRSGGHADNRDQRRSAKSVLQSLGMGKQYRDSASGSALYSQVKYILQKWVIVLNIRPNDQLQHITTTSQEVWDIHKEYSLHISSDNGIPYLTGEITYIATLLIGGEFILFTCAIRYTSFGFQGRLQSCNATEVCNQSNSLQKWVVVLTIWCAWLPQLQHSYFVTTTSQDVCRKSIRNDVCVSQVTMILSVIIPYLTEEIMFHISIKTGYNITEVTTNTLVKTTTPFFAVN